MELEKFRNDIGVLEIEERRNAQLLGMFDGSDTLRVAVIQTDLSRKSTHFLPKQACLEAAEQAAHQEAADLAEIRGEMEAAIDEARANAAFQKLIHRGESPDET